MTKCWFGSVVVANIGFVALHCVVLLDTACQTRLHCSIR